jgi:hypothetical protein
MVIHLVHWHCLECINYYLRLVIQRIGIVPANVLFLFVSSTGKYIGGCNDGPGLLPLAREGKLDDLLQNAGLTLTRNVK